jgi:nitronate monooxygenase
MRTWLSERLGLRVPVVCAPMAGVAGGALAAAVSAAGGLGMIGAGDAAAPDWIRRECEVARSAGAPFGVGLMAWAVERNPEQLSAALESRPALVSVSYGRYERFLAPIREAGAVSATQVGTVAEALAAERAGVEVIVARGGEGGGHGRNDVATLPLLQAVLERVNAPLLAAGGIATARGLAAVLAAGAQGAWVGTAFLACSEAQTAPAARARLFQAAETDTAYGRVFDIALGLGWPPEYGGRALRNRFFDAWAAREAQLAGDEHAAEQLRSARERGDYDTAYIYAGQGVGMLTREQTAAEVLAEFTRAHELLARFRVAACG